MIWKINKSNKVISNGQLSFTIDKVKNENNKKEYGIFLSGILIASYSKEIFCIEVIKLLFDYLNNNPNITFKFPCEDNLRELIKNGSNKN